MNHLIFLIICFLSSLYGKNNYDYLLEWGKNNSLLISNKLGMRYTNENNKTYYALEEIPENTLIMDIPFKIMLNINNALEMLHSKKLNNLYKEYQKDIFEISVGFLPASLDQSFLSYLLYLVNHRQKHYKKNKFYQYFQYLINSFETNLDNFPLFYNKNQYRLLQGSLAFMESTLMKELFKEEVDKLEHIHKQKEIDFDEYLRFRTLTITKSLNISNVTSIIPFIDMFANDPIDYNVNFKLNETNNNLYVFTTKKVKRGDILYIRSGYFSNIKRFVLYGDTFEKMKDYIESFQIPMISSNMLYNMKQEEQRYDFDESIDLNKKKFYKKALKTYKKVSILNKEDGSDLSAYKLFLKNLELMRENYNHITTSDIHKEFVNIKDIYNVRRVLELEKKFLDGKLNVLRDFIGKLEKKSKKETENKVNKDL
jgi:hypothetical protein